MAFVRTQEGLSLTCLRYCAPTDQFSEFHAGKDHLDFLAFDSENISIWPHLKRQPHAATHFVNLTRPFTAPNCSFLRAIGRLG